MSGVLSPLRDGGAAAVVCSAGADLDALPDALREAEEVVSTPVDSGVSPCGIDKRGSVVCEIGGSRGCVRMPVIDGVGSDPTGGRDSTGSVRVTSPSLMLTLIGTGRGTGVVTTGSLLGVAEPAVVSCLASQSQRDVRVRTCVARLPDADFIANGGRTRRD